MVSEEVNQKVLMLWESKYADSTKNVWMPLVYPDLQEKNECILFVSLNPSFNVKGIIKILKDMGHANIEPEIFYGWVNRSQFDLAMAIEIEKIARKNYVFFSRFKDLANYCKLPWEHIDLFFYRETKQNKFKSEIFLNGDKNELNEFGREQMKLSRMLIEAADPRIIIVANALASQIFKREFRAEFTEELGCHVVQLNNKTVPVFLTSMLTGQRAMDNYSYNRLKWHIKYVFSKKI